MFFCPAFAASHCHFGPDLDNLLQVKKGNVKKQIPPQPPRLRVKGRYIHLLHRTDASEGLGSLLRFKEVEKESLC